MTDMPPYLAVKDDEKSSDNVENDISKDVDDWDLPLSFNKPRHLEPIKGAERVEHTWRVKEKVRILLSVESRIVSNYVAIKRYCDENKRTWLID